MNTLVVYDTQFGNTERVARAIAAELERLGTVRLAAAGDEPALDLTGIDLLVAGGPTQAHGARQVFREWAGKLPRASLDGLAVATFDTRVHWPAFLAGSAAKAVAKILQHGGARLVVPPESFIVSGGEGPLADGELERATAWAATVAVTVGAVAAGAR